VRGKEAAMARHLVWLTLDFDAVSTWIRRGQTAPAASPAPGSAR
jgi:hypothetical protein